ncbi:hypothetical protein SESBI_33198 [Sesbania bispinosa]|nr:hypothetical protein SESBI_33198 [Sesbania bispinosa]
MTNGFPVNLNQDQGPDHKNATHPSPSSGTVTQNAAFGSPRPTVANLHLTPVGKFPLPRR